MSDEDFIEYLRTLELYDIQAVVGFVRHYYDRVRECDNSDTEEYKRRLMQWIRVSAQYGGAVVEALDNAILSMKENGYDFVQFTQNGQKV